MFDKYQSKTNEKDRIFSIAMKMMETEGYEKLSIRKICSAAEISTGKFYTYFQSKQDLLSYYYRQAEQAFSENAKDKFDGLDLKTQIVEFYGWYMEYTASFGVEFVMHYFNTQNEAMDISTYNNYIMNTTDNFLEVAIQNGFKLPSGKSIHQLSIDFCIIVKGVIFTWVAERGNFSLSETTKDLLSRCISGLLDCH